MLGLALLELGGRTFARRLGRTNTRRGWAAIVAVVALVAVVAVVAVVAMATVTVTVTVTVLPAPVLTVPLVAIAVFAVPVVAALTVMLAALVLVPPMPRTPLLVPRTPLFMPRTPLVMPRFAFLTRLCVRRGVSSLRGVDRRGVGAGTRRRVVRAFGEGRADTRCAAQCAAAALA